MSDMKYAEVFKTRINEFSAGIIDSELLSKYRQLIGDNRYYDFISDSQNGGFFFNKSLHIYGYSDIYNFHNVDFVNHLLKEKYNEIVDGLLSFGQDIFGNQFSFDIKRDKIVLFNIETGEREIIANRFTDWIELLFDQIDYFTGQKLAAAWNVNNNLNFDQRLCPKIPFILGGDYALNNLYASTFPDFISSAADIARQVYNLPDGTEFKIKIKKK